MTGTPLTISAGHVPRRVVAFAVVRTIATIALVVAIYFLIPLDRPLNAGVITGLVLGALALGAIIVLQLRRIVRSKHPVMRGVEALSFMLPVYVLLFATAYFLMAHDQAASFGEHLSRTDSMYFSTTVFTTVGFGDITAKTQAARVVVTVQMILDLVFLGLVVRLIVNAVKISQQRQGS